MRRRKAALDEQMIRDIHRRMFDKTWRWAGCYRTSDKNIGSYWANIPSDVRNLVDDGVYWFEHGTYPIYEAAMRLHHRLVRVHPFPNGNGRHARLWCDLLLTQNGREPFQWKSDQLDKPGVTRDQYVHALGRADAGDFDELFELYVRDR